MGIFKKGLWGMCFMVFLFIALMFLEIAGENPFDSSFVAIGGAMLFIAMGFFETNLVTL